MAVSRHQIEQCEGRVARLKGELGEATEKLRGLRATMKEEKAGAAAAAKGGGAAAGAMTAPKVKAKAPKKAKPKARSGTLAGAT